MSTHSSKTRGADHEIVILSHLVQMVKAVRGIRDEDIAERLGVSVGMAAQMLSESARLTFEQLRQLFLAVGMATDGVFDAYPGQPEKTALAPMGFGNAIDQGLQILNEEGLEEEEAAAAAT
jgi:transcriptional regulator with XRE-family HTH domain